MIDVKNLRGLLDLYQRSQLAGPGKKADDERIYHLCNLTNALVNAAPEIVLVLESTLPNDHSAEACKRKFDEVPQASFGAAPPNYRGEPVASNPFISGSSARCSDCDPTHSCFFSGSAACAKAPPKE